MHDASSTASAHRPDAAEPLVQVQRDARGVVTLTLNDPARMNALGRPMLAALQSAIDGVAADASARVLVLAAQGRAFCAGHDMREMAAQDDLASHQALFARCSRMMLSLQKLPVPVIAQVQGMATAAGCQLVAQCDLAVASSAAAFATSGIRYGLFCATPSVPLVRNLPIKKAMEMLLTGDFIDAATALEQGLVNRVAAPEALAEAVEALVQSILDKPRAAVAMGKAVVYQQRELGIEAAYQLAGQAMAVNMQDDDAREGVGAFAQKRQPRWRSAA